MEVILGSTSPRRKKILSSIIDDFTVIPPGIDEKAYPGEKPEDFAVRAAFEKSQSIIGQHSSGNDTLIITSDTIVTIDDIILGKPQDYKHAMEILSLLRGRTHRVITGISLIYSPKGISGNPVSLRSYESTRVFFRDVSDMILSDYLDRIEYHDKAGSYAIQEHGDMIIDGIEGSMTNIIGFPLRLLFSMLSSIDAVEKFFRLTDNK